jgi:hypothetical protein
MKGRVLVRRKLLWDGPLGFFVGFLSATRPAFAACCQQIHSINARSTYPLFNFRDNTPKPCEIIQIRSLSS